MARARNIKPGFFKNEDLAECTPWARLCFAGLWTLADREGRLEDRPKRIKGELFAYDSVEVEPLLVELERFGFVERYRNSDGSFIQISKFSEHQTPHYSEKPSVIKPPDFQELDFDDEGNTPRELQEDSEKDDSLRGGRNPLNPDSLNPDSLIPESRILIPEEIPQAKACSSSSLDAPQDPEPEEQAENPKTKLPPCPHLDVLQLWAEVLPAMPQHNPEMWRGTRADHLRARWRETAAAKKWPDQDAGLAYFRKLFAFVSKSPFLTGQTRSSDPSKRPFTIELEWLVNPTNWAKVHEGKYHQEA